MILRRFLRGAALSAALLASTVGAALPELIEGNAESIKNVAATVAFDTMQYYTENQTGQIPGKLPGTWWEGGFLFNMLIQYWHFTGDPSYNPTVTQGMLWQKGANNDYMPANWSSYLGNDDQVFWGLAAMTAAEVNFPTETDQDVSWLALAQGVFNTQAARWDASSCGGGLRWQLNSLQGGYTLKNAVSNGGFFQLAARLALYTGNSSYADWAIKMWDWSAQSPLLNETTWNVADSTSTGNNCTTQGDLQWTYNYGVYFYGAAAMYNYTKGSSLWQTRVDGLLGVFLSEFFPEDHGGMILSEPACDVPMNCNRDQNCFKGLVSSWMAFTTYWVPETIPKIMPKLQASAKAAVLSCNGGSDGQQCNVRWWQEAWDNTQGIEQEASVLSIVSVQLLNITTGKAPVTASTGGTSKSDPGEAGNVGSDTTIQLTTITLSDKVGAGIVTALLLLIVVGGGTWLLWP